MKANENVGEVLRVKADQVRTGADIIMARTNDWQIIKAYMCNRLADFQLTPVQQLKLDRYQFIYNQLVTGKYTNVEVVSQVMKMQGGISMSQAYEDINCAREVFNSVINVNKLFEIKLELEIAKSMKNKCVQIMDFKTAALIEKNIIKLLELLPSEDDSPGDGFEGHEIEAVFDPSLLGAPEVDMNEVLAAINAKRKVKVNIDMFETLPHTDLTDEETSAF